MSDEPFASAGGKIGVHARRLGCLDWDNFHQYRLHRLRCQEVTVSGCTIINADFQSCQIMYRPIQNNRSRLFSFGRGTLRFNTANCWRKAAFSKATCFWPPRMRRMKRIETTIAFNMATRVCNHQPEESTAWKSNKVLANHRFAN